MHDASSASERRHVARSSRDTPGPGVDVPEGEHAVTAVRTQATPVPVTPSGAAVASGPSPRRVRPPRWLDLRLVLGVLLVLGSVLLGARVVGAADATVPVWAVAGDRKSTRLNSSHANISYAVFCLKKKKITLL